MSITLEHAPGNVAVLRGLRTSSALVHLSRSLSNGVLFDGYRGLVVDLGGAVTDGELAAAMDAATAACLRRRQVVAFATGEREVGSRLRAVRGILRLLDREQGLGFASRVAQSHASAFAGASTAAFELVSVRLPRALGRGRSSAIRVHHVG